MLDRRHLLILLGGLAGAMPCPSRAQVRAGPARVVLLAFGRVQGPVGRLHESFRRGMRELGYVEGKNVVYDLVTTDGNAARVDAAAAKVIRLNPDPVRGKDVLSTAERQELARLRRENKQLKLERDILAKATAWFAGKGDKTSIGSSNS